MTRARGTLRRAWDLLVDPVTPEKRALLERKWSTLPDAAKTPSQGFGRQGTGCGATIGVEPLCDFSCTGCYLGLEANATPALPISDIFEQLRRLRSFLGPKSNVQITDGEVTLRPEDELIEIVRHATSIGMIPMVMTHGDTFRRRPRLLPRLMIEGGLTEVSIHVDITQRGRDGYRSPKSEVDLMPLRDEFAAMIRNVRHSTGRRLRAATTLTVTQENLSQVRDVARWAILNHDAFSLVSFQPAARVGRTREGIEGVSSGELWREIGRTTAEFGAQVSSPRPLDFGHPDCSHYAPFITVRRSGSRAPRLIQLVRDHPDDVAILEEYLSRPSIGMTFRDDSPIEVVGRALGALRLDPRWFFGRARRWVDRRLRESIGTTFFPLLASALAGRTEVRGLTFASHHFMSSAEIATARGRERIASCVFSVPIGDRMVSMCEVNAGGIRDEYYDDLAGRDVPAAARADDSVGLESGWRRADSEDSHARDSS